MPSYPLAQSARATADSDGIATVRIGPRRAFERWHIKHVSVQSTSSTLVPELREYRGDVAESRLIGSSRSGNLDSGAADIDLVPGEDLVYRWTNCDVGSTCTVTLEGRTERP